ncbi:MAG: hypothetical protein ABEI06_05725 [Halobacteriaceae archaeon]
MTTTNDESPALSETEKIMASLDENGERLVIADITRDDAWLSAMADQSVKLFAWR